MQAVFPRRFWMKNGINKEPNQADDQNKCCDERTNCFFHDLCSFIATRIVFMPIIYFSDCYRFFIK